MSHLWEISHPIYRGNRGGPDFTLDHMSEIYEHIPKTAKLLYWSWCRQPTEDGDDLMYNGVFMMFIDTTESEDKNVWDVIVNPNESELESEEAELKTIIHTQTYQPLKVSSRTC